MTKKSKILVASLLAVSLVGAGTAAAFIIKGANTSTSGSVEDAIYLSWGETQTITDVVFDDPAESFVRCVSVNAPETNLTSAEAHFYLTLTADEGKSLGGLSVGIFDDEQCQEANRLGTATQLTSFTSDVITTAKTFYLKFTMESTIWQTYVDGEQSFGGKATLSYNTTL